MSALQLIGGPADGQTVEAPGAIWISVPEYVSPKRRPTKDDRFFLNPFRYVDPDCNPTFRQHRYDARTGEYKGTA